jgi:MYXO-CTERM domain-containing protein
MNKMGFGSHMGPVAVTALALALLLPNAADASCFCDIGKQEFVLPTELACLTIVPSEGCVKIGMANGCKKAVTLTKWPGLDSDKTIAAGAQSEVQVYGYSAAIPTSSDLLVVMDGTTLTIVHKTPETCTDGACSVSTGPTSSSPFWLLAILCGALLLSRKLVSRTTGTPS